MPKKSKSPETFNEFLGAEVAGYLKKRGKGQDDLVADLGWKTSTVGRKLRGETAFNVEELIEVGEYLEASVAAIIDAATADFARWQQRTMKVEARRASAVTATNVTQLRTKKFADLEGEELDRLPYVANDDPEAREDEQFD